MVGNTVSAALITGYPNEGPRRSFPRTGQIRPPQDAETDRGRRLIQRRSAQRVQIQPLGSGGAPACIRSEHRKARFSENPSIVLPAMIGCSAAKAGFA